MGNVLQGPIFDPWPSRDKTRCGGCGMRRTRQASLARFPEGPAAGGFLRGFESLEEAGPSWEVGRVGDAVLESEGRPRKGTVMEIRCRGGIGLSRRSVGSRVLASGQHLTSRFHPLQVEKLRVVCVADSAIRNTATHVLDKSKSCQSRCRSVVDGRIRVPARLVCQTAQAFFILTFLLLLLVVLLPRTVVGFQTCLPFPVHQARVSCLGTVLLHSVPFPPRAQPTTSWCAVRLRLHQDASSLLQNDKRSSHQLKIDGARIISVRPVHPQRHRKSRRVSSHFPSISQKT